MLIWDNHICMPIRAEAEFLPQLKRCRRAGVGMVSVNVVFDLIPWQEGIRVLAFMRDWILRRPDEYVLVGRVEDVERARAENRLAVAFDIEGMKALDGQVSMVRTYYDLGVRWMLVAYNLNNEAGGGCQDTDSGLTPFGRQVIDEMARVGMVVCCSHTGERTTMDVFERASGPVVLTHSNPKALVDHPRNVSDAVLKACAETGGVIGMVGFGYFLSDGDASSENFVRHIDYAVQLVGPEHVGIGTDYVFDGQELLEFLTNHRELYPEEAGYVGMPQMVAPEQFPQIVDALLGLGYSDADVRAVMGENWLRVARQVWK